MEAALPTPQFLFNPRCPCRCKTLYAFRKTHSEFGFRFVPASGFIFFHGAQHANAGRATGGTTRSGTRGFAFGFAQIGARKSSAHRLIGRGFVSSAARSAGLVWHAHSATTTGCAAPKKSTEHIAPRVPGSVAGVWHLALENGAPVGFGHFVEPAAECATIRSIRVFRIVAADSNLRRHLAVA